MAELAGVEQTGSRLPIAILAVHLVAFAATATAVVLIRDARMSQR